MFKDLIKNEKEAVIFYKPGCPFCAAAEKLLNELTANGIIEGYSTIYVEDDISNPELKEIVTEFGWSPDSHQQFPTKPQIFVRSEYVGGNSEFYKSKWNLAEELEIDGEKLKTPNLKNPMAF